MIIDTLVINLAIAPGVALLLVGSGMLRLVGVALAALGFLAVAYWYQAAVASSGQWIGNRVMSTKVVSVSKGELLTPTNAATRFLVRSIISPVFLFGFLPAFTNSSRRTLHDQIAGSIVTRPPREAWSIDDERE